MSGRSLFLGVYIIFYGTKGEKVRIEYMNARGISYYDYSFDGVIGNLRRRYNETSDAMKGEYEQYMTDGVLDLSKCPKWQEYGLTLYDPVYAVVFAPDEENEKVLDFLEFFCQ